MKEANVNQFMYTYIGVECMNISDYVKGLTSGEALRVIIALANNYMEDCATVLYPWFLALLSTRDHSGPGRYLREVSLYH